MKTFQTRVFCLLILLAFVFPVEAAQAREVKLFFIAVDDNGASGKKIGCNDSVVPVDVSVGRLPSTLRTAYNRLLSTREESYGPRNLSNPLSKSRLRVKSIVIRNRTAIIKLTGRLVSAGACEDPRLEAQLTETALQFPTVRRVSVFVNNVPLGRVLSGQ